MDEIGIIHHATISWVIEEYDFSVAEIFKIAEAKDTRKEEDNPRTHDNHRCC